MNARHGLRQHWQINASARQQCCLTKRELRICPVLLLVTIIAGQFLNYAAIQNFLGNTEPQRRFSLDDGTPPATNAGIFIRQTAGRTILPLKLTQSRYGFDIDSTGYLGGVGLHGS